MFFPAGCNACVYTPRHCRGTARYPVWPRICLFGALSTSLDKAREGISEPRRWRGPRLSLGCCYTCRHNRVAAMPPMPRSHLPTPLRPTRLRLAAVAPDTGPEPGDTLYRPDGACLLRAIKRTASCPLSRALPTHEKRRRVPPPAPRPPGAACPEGCSSEI